MVQSTKYLLALFLFLFICNNVVAQKKEKSVLLKYLNSNLSKNIDDPYVYLYITQKKKIKKTYYYYKKENQFVLAYFHADSNYVAEKFFTQDELFQVIDNNLEHLQKLSYNTHDAGTFQKKFADPVNLFSQIGIRYANLHYNHYQQADSVLIGKIADEGLKTGYITIDRIVSFFRNQF